MKREQNRLLAIGLLSGSLALLPASWEAFPSSIHFYDGTAWMGEAPPIDFGRLPQEVMITGWNNEAVRAGTAFSAGTGPWDRFYQFDYLCARARNLEVREQYAQALRCYKMALRLADDGRHNDYLGEQGQIVRKQTAFRSFVRDREEVFALRQTPNLQKYLKARPNFQIADPTKLRELRRDSALGAHAWYASLAIGDSAGYLELAQAHPGSPRAPAALLMAARAMLTPKKPTANINAALKVLDRLIIQYPQTGYIPSAMGWMGRAFYLQGHVDRAQQCYYRQIADSRSDADIWRAYDSLALINAQQGLRSREAICRLRQWSLKARHEYRVWAGLATRKVFGRLRSEEAIQVQRAIRKDPKLLAAYLAFRLEGTRLNRAKERNLLAFATSSLRDFPKADSETLVRVAQLSYDCGKYRSAIQLANRALKSTGLAKSRACYISAASAARLGLPRMAIRTYERLISLSPPDFLKHSAKENLAMLQERHGDPVKALRYYYEVDNQLDVAFLADAKLTIPQLTRFISGLPRSAQPKFQYTLAMRLMRVGQYNRAKSVLLQLPAGLRNSYGVPPARFAMVKRWLHRDELPKVARPVKVADDLIRLDARIARSRSSKARAHAIYDKGAYLYKNRSLLFYSLGLWEGSRAFQMSYHFNKQVNSRADYQALERHNYEHECLAQSLKLFKQIMATYPRSKVMPKALYSGAVASERLSNLNEWWRARGLPLKQQSVRWLNRLAKSYPNHELAAPAEKYAEFFKEQIVEWKKQ